MAVHTALSLAQIQLLLEPYDLGRCTWAAAIEHGMENSNYFVTIADNVAPLHSSGPSKTLKNEKAQEFVLSILESLNIDELEYYLSVLMKLQSAQLPIACPIPDRQQRYFQLFASKPVILMRRLNGSHPKHANLK